MGRRKVQRVKEYLDKVDTGRYWEKLKDEIAALTDDESEWDELLILRIIADLNAKSSTKSKEKSMIQKKGKKKEACYLMKKQQGTKNEKKSFKRSIYDHESGEEEYMVMMKQKGTKNEGKGIKRIYDDGLGERSEEEEEGYLLMRRQKGAKNEKKGIKRTHDEVGKRSQEEEEEEYMLMRPKQKKHTTAGNEKKRKIDEVVVFTAMGLDPPPNIMPEAFRKHIENLGGTKTKLVLQKIIHPTDLKRWENRLAISMKKVLNKFLSEAEEEEITKNKLSKDKKGMEVVLVQPCLQTSKINLTKWVIGGSPSYVLNSQWWQVVEDNADALNVKNTNPNKWIIS